MTQRGQPREPAVLWLTAQTALFGAMAALLGVVGNALFLDAYGPEWLPVTYIVIGLAGIVISAAIARSSQRFDLLRIAVAVLGAAAFLLGVSWLVAIGGGAWVSGPLLVLFPILIQLGFVFIGGQAGRILDIAGIKASFPRIMAGFPAGAVAGGLLAVPLVELTGRTEDLLLVTALVQAGFASLVWATGHRYHSALVLPPQPPAPQPPGEQASLGDPADGDVEQTLRGLLRTRFVALILAYQVLSALGSQLSDYLVFDRASAAFAAAEDLAQFIGGYTAVMNAVSIAFLFLLAGPLLRRFGLRLGIAANPIVLTVLAAAMVVVLVPAGPASMALLAVVSAARVGDIALTDGTTRTSINALYQVLPPGPRIAVQTYVEGIGVPVAIGVSGVLILVLNALPGALPLTIAVLLVVCAAWTLVGMRLYRAYGPALIDALRHRAQLDPAARFQATIEDVVAARRLVASADVRSTRLALELAAAMDTPALAPELVNLARDPRAEVRLAALAVLAASGDEEARRRLAADVRSAAGSADAVMRAHAAAASASVGPEDRAAVARLMDDPDPNVRIAALEAVQPGDDHAVERVVRALRDTRSAPAAIRACDRLGDALAPALDAVLADPDPMARSVAIRMLRGLATPSSARDEVLRRHVGHRDRAIGHLVLTRLGGVGSPPAGDSEAIGAVLGEDATHAASILRAGIAIDADTRGAGDEPVLRALDDELDLIRARVAAALAVRYSRGRLGQSLARYSSGGDGRALAAEAIEVVAGAADSRLALALLDPTLSRAERLERLPGGEDGPARDAVAWLREIFADPRDAWRSPWLVAAAIRALRLRGVVASSTEMTAAAIDDPVVSEELALSNAARGA